MNSLDWDDLRVFLAAARGGSLSAASRALNSNQPTVGRRIAALERALGLRLFQRHAQGLTLMEDGQRVLRAAEDMDNAATALNRHIPLNEPGTLDGTVRVAVPEGLAVNVIAPALRRFLELYPGLDITLEPSAASADLVRGEADIAVRLYRPGGADLVVRRVCEMEFGLYAAFDYLRVHGVPATAGALSDHRFISYGRQLADHPESVWLSSLAGPARCVLRSDNTLTRLTAARAGLGIAVLPRLLVGETGLQRVLPELAPPARTVWLVVHRDLQHVPRNRAVMEFLAVTLEDAQRSLCRDGSA